MLRWVIGSVVIILVVYFLTNMIHLVLKIQESPPWDDLTFNHREEPVDAVITWVDSTCPKWITEYNSWRMKLFGETKLDPDRFSSNVEEPDLEVSTSVLSMNKFTPWLRRIFIVTHPGQRPRFLDNYKGSIPVQIVHHDEFIPRERLPLFNSHAIEFHLDRIPGLSEHFLYANDDMFFGKETSPRHFFARKGVPMVGMSMVYLNIPLVRQGHVLAWVNTCRLLDKKWILCNAPDHTIVPLTRSLFTTVLQEFNTEFRVTAECKFRDLDMDSQLPPIGFILKRGIQTGRVLTRHRSIKYSHVPFLKSIKNANHNTIGENSNNINLVQKIRSYISNHPDPDVPTL